MAVRRPTCIRLPADVRAAVDAERERRTRDGYRPRLASRTAVLVEAARRGLDLDNDSAAGGTDPRAEGGE